MKKLLRMHRFVTMVPGMLLLLGFVTSAGAAEGDRVSLPLLEGLRIVLGRTPDLRIEAFSYASSEADLARSYSIYDPLVSGSAFTQAFNAARDDRGMDRFTSFSVGINQLIPTGGSLNATVQTGFDSFSQGSTEHNSSVTVGFTQPVLRNAGITPTELSITTAKNVLEDALERYRAMSIDATLLFIGIYNRLYSARNAVLSKQQSLEAARALLEETTARQTTGTASRLDLLNAEYGVVQRQKDLVDAERNVRDLEGSVRIILDTTDPRPIYPTDPPALDEPMESEDQAVSIAKEMRPDLKQLRLSLKLAELQERVSRNATLPDLVLNGSAGLNGFGGTIGDNITQMGYGNGFWTLGGNISYPLGNTAADNDYRKAKIRTDQLKTQIAALEMKTENDIRTDLRAIISARLQLRVTKKAREAAELRLEENKESNRRGEATMQNVLEAEADLSFARISEVEAAEGFSAAVVKLWRDMGVLLERKGIKFVKPADRQPIPPGPLPALPTGVAPAPAPVPPVTPQTAPAPAVTPTVEPAPPAAPAPAPASVPEATVKPAVASNLYFVRLADPKGVPLKPGTRVHDVANVELQVEAAGVVGIPVAGKHFVSLVAYPDEPCWVVVPMPAEPVAVGAETPMFSCQSVGK